ncbi:hypothetical protein AB0H86_39330 [Streptomyces sp. NPDC050997]|uniref:hypothetical protein n=1 Tax=Streptomyces sp. NPDC050997 TaxID=3155519 RepID=UPI003442C875
MAAAGGAPLPVQLTVSTLTVAAELAPGADGTARLRLPARLKLPAGRHPVTFPKADTPVAYAVVRDGSLLRLEGPAYQAGTGRRLRDAVGDDRRIRRLRRRLGR